MSALLAASVPDSAAQNQIRVMVVDDSAVVRGLLAGWIEEQPDLRLAASPPNGREALDQFERADPDVVILDIEMPVLDGLSTLPLLLARKPSLVVIMASAITRHDAEISLKALALGAADYIPKPTSKRTNTDALPFRRELIEKIRELGARTPRNATDAPQQQPVAKFHTWPQPVARASTPAPQPGILRKLETKPRALLIGASTGGPQALTALLSDPKLVSQRLPILIVQHMPATFTAILAEHLTRSIGRPVREAEHGEPITAGAIYLAPGGLHMQVAREGDRAVIHLNDRAPVFFCKPAVDPLFASAVEVWGGALVAVILTGMGHDGTAGARAVSAAGGTVIAQDEATSVVWGMPGSAVRAGACAAVLPLSDIAPKITRLFAGDIS